MGVRWSGLQRKARGREDKVVSRGPDISGQCFDLHLCIWTAGGFDIGGRRGAFEVGVRV